MSDARTVKVHAPVAGFTGDGPGEVKFEDGVAEVSLDDYAALAYFTSAGYGIGEPVAPAEPAPAAGPHPGDEVIVGTRLADALLDEPEPELELELEVEEDGDQADAELEGDLETDEPATDEPELEGDTEAPAPKSPRSRTTRKG